MILVDMIGDKNLNIKKEAPIDGLAEGHHLGNGAIDRSIGKSFRTTRLKSPTTTSRI